jgi:hypothetical protein
MASIRTCSLLRRAWPALAWLLSASCARPSTDAAEQPAPHVGSTLVRFAPRAIRRGETPAAPVALTLRKTNAHEQQWWFSERPRGEGPLEVRVGVTGGTFERDDGEGLVFSAGATRVRYGHGTWIDARGTRVPVPARFDATRGEIVLALAAERLAQSAFPAVLDPDIVLVNGTGLIDSRVGASAVYPTAASDPPLAVAVTYNRGTVSPSSGIWSISPATAASTLLGGVDPFDTVGLAMHWTGVPQLFAMRRVTTLGTGLRFELVTRDGAVLSPSLGAAPLAPPWLSCARLDPSGPPTGAGCAVAYGLAASAGTNAQQFIIGGPPVPPPVLRPLSGPVSVDGEQDVDFLLGRPVVVWSQRSGAGSDVFVRMLPRIGLTDAMTPRVYVLPGGSRPRVACNDPRPVCALVYRRGPELLAVQFDPDADRVLNIEMRDPPAGSEHGPHDITSTRTGFRVAVIEVTARGASIRLNDSSRSELVMGSPSEQTVPIPPGTYSDLRMDTALANDVSIAAWAGGSGGVSQAWGAVIRPDVDAGPLPPRDASADGSNTRPDAAGDGGMDPARDGALDADADDAAMPDDATLTRDDADADDAAMQDDARTGDPRQDARTSDGGALGDASLARTPRFGGGACECRTGAPASRSLDGRALVVLAAVAAVARRRARHAGVLTARARGPGARPAR